MIASIIAAVVEGNDSVSLAALGTFVAVVLGAVGAFLAKKKGKQEGSEEEKKRRVTIEDQPLGVRMEERFVTHAEFTGHMERVEDDITEIKHSLDSERGIARAANGNIHKRIDSLSENVGGRISKMEGTVEAVKENTDKLLDIALGRKPKGGQQ